MEVDNFLKVGKNIDSLYHFDVRYSFEYKDKKYKGSLYFFNNKVAIDESNKNLMTYMFNTVLKYIQDHHCIKNMKGEQLEIGLNFDKRGKRGFKEIEDEFLRKLPICDNCFRWC